MFARNFGCACKRLTGAVKRVFAQKTGPECGLLSQIKTLAGSS
jgi:hypothetical protein